MTVFLAHVEADLEAAEALAKAVERRGLFVEHEDGEHVGRTLQAKDALVLFWSSASAEDAHRLSLERRALDAWADGKLVLVALDSTSRPVGLRDLPAVDAHDYDHWPEAWDTAMAVIAAAVNAALSAPPPDAPAAAPVPTKKEEPTEPPARGGKGFASLFVLVALLGLIGLGAFAYQRVQYAVFEMPPAWLIWSAVGAGILLAVLARVALSPKKKKRAKAKAKPEKAPPPPAPPALAVFVSYAHDDAVAVGPVVAVVEGAGRPVLIDRGEVSAQENIRSAQGVVVMCSPAAFQSDRVKREVFLADRHRKPVLAIFVKPAPTPQDFEFFFAGAQSLDLGPVPENERPTAIRNALAKV
jgi:TIR domain